MSVSTQTLCPAVLGMFVVAFFSRLQLPNEMTVGTFEEELGTLLPWILALVLQGPSSWAPDF